MDKYQPRLGQDITMHRGIVGLVGPPPQMAVVFSLIFGRFALVFTAFCLYVAVPLVRFSTFFSLFV